MRRDHPPQICAASLLEIVRSAFARSLGTVPPIVPFAGGLTVFPGGSARDISASFRGKVIVFGPPPTPMLPLLGLGRKRGLASLVGADTCSPAEKDTPFTESSAFLVYREHELAEGIVPCLYRRPFTRFDYADEWNNLGFGRIRTDGSIWAAHGGFIPNGAMELAGMAIHSTDGPTYCGSYLTLHDTPNYTALWCARPVGPLDSTEWTAIERFISDWRADELPCLPVLCQAPAGSRCVVTMRLDCDEAVSSAGGLFSWYAEESIPFSLAVKTSLEFTREDLSLMEAVRAAGGTLLSHSHTHPADWSATPEEALAEAEASRRWFAATWPELPPADLAVSPFHTNPPYAVRALAQAGFTGFVSGLVHNDPEYLLGRAGTVPFAGRGIVSVSQQSMLHGDCYRRQGGSVAAHVAAFEVQYTAGGIFGYLDHPFSARYAYDWESEEQRLTAHRELIAAIRSREGVLFWSQQQCFDFVKTLAGVKPVVSPSGVLLAKAPPGPFALACRYKGREHRL